MQICVYYTTWQWQWQWHCHYTVVVAELAADSGACRRGDEVGLTSILDRGQFLKLFYHFGKLWLSKSSDISYRCYKVINKLIRLIKIKIMLLRQLAQVLNP